MVTNEAIRRLIATDRETLIELMVLARDNYRGW